MRYDHRVLVTAGQTRDLAGRSQAGRGGYGAFARRRSLERRRSAQLLGIHAVAWLAGTDSVCTCGLVVSAPEALDSATGHLALPDLGRGVYVLVVEAQHASHAVVCQRCGYRSRDVDERTALVDRTRHEHACLPAVPMAAPAQIR